MGIIEPGTLIFSFLGFLIIYWIIWRVAYKPLASMMQQRRSYVEDQIVSAETSNAEAQRMVEEQRAMLEQARNEVREMLDSARQRADEQARDIIAKAQEEAQRLLDEGRQMIDRERREATSQVLTQVADLTVSLTTKLLRNHITAEAQEAIVKEAESELSELVC